LGSLGAGDEVAQPASHTAIRRATESGEIALSKPRVGSRFMAAPFAQPQ
jgi:hypothetical protein